MMWESSSCCKMTQFYLLGLPKLFEVLTFIPHGRVIIEGGHIATSYQKDKSIKVIRSGMSHGCI